MLLEFSLVVDLLGCLITSLGQSYDYNLTPSNQSALFVALVASLSTSLSACGRRRSNRHSLLLLEGGGSVATRYGLCRAVQQAV